MSNFSEKFPVDEMEKLLEEARNQAGDLRDFPRHQHLCVNILNDILSILQDKCQTCEGTSEIEICNNCGKKLQKTNVYPKLSHCIECGKGKPITVPCPDCSGQKGKVNDGRNDE